MTATPIRIVVVDDSPLYRGVICGMLEKQPNLQVVAEAGDGRYAIQAVQKHRPDVVLMDITMPILDGIEATRSITSNFPDTKVIVFTMYIDQTYSNRAFQAGACRFLAKGCHMDDILDAILKCSSEPSKVIGHPPDQPYP
ncbi:MAG: response regulator transcription factor [Deltaproteobacteria bacterium]|nr:response regulator transcription factor [Deltaproteobacteria bacterium]